jgi:hypothetical protein
LNRYAWHHTLLQLLESAIIIRVDGVRHEPPALAAFASYTEEFRGGTMMMKRLVLSLSYVLLFLFPARSQDEEKIQKLFQDAIQTMGGDAYMKVTDIVSEGNLFFFNRDGDSSGLIKFNDYTKFPDKSRFELGNRKKARDVTVFDLAKNEGWILEGQKETRAATAEEMKSFKDAVKHSLDMILRFRYKDPNNQLFYLGPGEGADVRLEAVKILDPENDEVTVYFDRAGKLPAKIEYRSINKRGIVLREVEEYSQWLVVQGINTPLRTDKFQNRFKSSQQFIVKITYNNSLPDSFFIKPEPPK